MISLNVHVDLEGASPTPFVARLRRKHLIGDFASMCVFQSVCGTLTFPECSSEELLGDVVYIDPNKKLASRWIRQKSTHNTLLVTERCDQLCVMCSQPPKKSHTDYFKYFYDACILADQNQIIGFSGGEPTLYKAELFELLLKLHDERPDLSFHVLTNGQHFEEEDISTLRQCIRVMWGVPLYAHYSDLHDAIVLKKGAYVRLEESLSYLMRAGANVELRTVVLQNNYKTLPQLAQKISDQMSFISVWAIMQLESIGFAKNRWNDIFVDHSLDIKPLTGAINLTLAHGVETQLYNFPLCTLPEELRVYAPSTISDWKQRYPKPCKICSKKIECSGVFEWHPDEKSYKELNPL